MFSAVLSNLRSQRIKKKEENLAKKRLVLTDSFMAECVKQKRQVT